MPDRDTLALSRAALSRADRRLPRVSPGAAPLHVLGLSGRALAPRRGAADRPSAVVAAGRRPGRRLRYRQDAARQGTGLRPYADLVRSGDLTEPHREQTSRTLTCPQSAVSGAARCLWGESFREPLGHSASREK